NTGARQGQLLKLEWRDVDPKRRLLTLRPETGKTKKANHVPLNGAAIGAVRDLQLERDDWIAQQLAEDGRKRESAPNEALFPGNVRKHWVNIHGLWDNVLADAKLEDFTFHDLRHTFASKLVQRGVDLFTVQKLLTHSDPKLTARYSHLAP